MIDEHPAFNAGTASMLEQIRVIDFIKAGKTNQQIASEMGLNIRTVENYISKIYVKTGFSTREEVRRL